MLHCAFTLIRPECVGVGSPPDVPEVVRRSAPTFVIGGLLSLAFMGFASLPSGA